MILRLSIKFIIVTALVCSLAGILGGCNNSNDQVIEQAGIQAKANAEAELRAQLAAKDQLIERARIEGRATAEAELITSNANLAAKAALMESDLATRQLFYQAVRGTYEGALQTERGEFRVRITLVPSLPPYTATRTRQLEEITADLNQLFLNAQIVQWNPNNRLSAVGCQVENIRPDLIRGQISIAAANCPNLYSLNIFDEEIKKNVEESELSTAVATAILSGQLTELSTLQGQVLPTTNASVFSFFATRTSR